MKPNPKILVPLHGKDFQAHDRARKDQLVGEDREKKAETIARAKD